MICPKNVNKHLEACFKGKRIFGCRKLHFSKEKKTTNQMKVSFEVLAAHGRTIGDIFYSFLESL